MAIKKDIFKILNRKYVESLFKKKKDLYFPSFKNKKISDIRIEKTSPNWAQRTCLVKYKVFFTDGNFITIRGTAKVDGSKRWSHDVTKYFYENGFSSGKFLVPRPLDYIEKNGLFIYEEAQGEPLASIIDRDKYYPKLSKHIAELLFRVHSLKNIRSKKKALIFDQKDYFKTYQRIKTIFPQIAQSFPYKKIQLIKDFNEGLSFIHGDFYTGNSIIRKNKIIMIDFDKAGQGPILYDLASFCYCFEFPKSIWPLSLSQKKINNYQHTFLKIYAQMAGWDLVWLKGALNKYMAKVFLNALNYYTGLVYEGWSILTEREKKTYFIQIKDLLRKANQYFKKYENFICGFRMRSHGKSGRIGRRSRRLA